MKVPRGPGRPRKWKGPTDIITLRLPVEIINRIDDIAAETRKSRTDVIVSLVTAASNVQVAKLFLRINSLEEYIEQLEKEKQALLEEREKLIDRVEKLELENKALKEKIAELKKQAKMTARERKAEDFKAEVYEVLERYGKNGMKMIDFLKKLGYTSNFDMHAKEFLDQWFVEEKYKLISEELGLVVEKDPHFGRLAWMVKRIDSFRFGKVAEVLADE